jgi:hypothetical protein
MAFGMSPESFREAEQQFITRARRREIDAGSHCVAEGIDAAPKPDPLDAVPNMMSLSLLAAVADAILKGLLDREEVSE